MDPSCSPLQLLLMLSCRPVTRNASRTSTGSLRNSTEAVKDSWHFTDQCFGNLVCYSALGAILWQLISDHVMLKIFSVPNVYPVDLFEHIWVVDRLERLGISRYFQREIEQNMDYVNRFFIMFCFISAIIFSN